MLNDYNEKPKQIFDLRNLIEHLSDLKINIDKSKPV